MPTTTYKGYRILARPYRLLGSDRWLADLEIRRHGRTQPVACGEQYATEAEAEERCLVMGRRIIDGEVPGVTVDRLRGVHQRRRRSLRIAEVPERRRDPFAWLVVVGLGIFVLLVGAGFATRGEAASLGEFGMAADNLYVIPPWVGGGAMVVGLLLILAGVRQRS